MKRPHTCPVVYLQNFSRISPKYYEKLKNYTVKTYRKPERNDFIIYAHNKVSNSKIFDTSLQNIGVRKNFYSKRVESYLRVLESKVGKQFRKIRDMTIATFINPFPVFRFIMSQLIRTPKFQKKIQKDQIFLMKMDEKEFQESIMRLLLVQKPKEVTQNSMNKIHEDFIMNNLLETIYKWSTITLATNNTDIPFITSDSPVVYNNAEFFPSYVNKVNRIEFSMIFSQNVTFYFPIDPRFAFMINRFNNQQKEPIIKDETIFDPELIMNMNMLEYQYSERFIYLRDKNEELVKIIRTKCGNDINKDYQLMEYSYSVMKEEIKKYTESAKEK
jgi:hypothetical protein